MRVTLYNDAGCPWGYSANPAFRVLEWRYGAQLEWRLVLIGLTNVAQEYVDRGYTPLRSAEGYARRFRRFGMPLAPNPRARIVGTGRSCRAIVAVRLQAPGREWAAFRALQFGFFTTTLLLDEDDSIAAVLRGVEGIDVDAAIAAIDTPAVEEAYQRDRAEARSAAGSPTQLQDKHATTDGPVRYTAPSLVFERAGRRLEAGGWQTIEAYDVIVANLIPDGERRGVPDDPLELLTAFPGGLTTQEVAQLLTRGNDAPDRVEAEATLLRLVADGAATRTPLGDDALWKPAEPRRCTRRRFAPGYPHPIGLMTTGPGRGGVSGRVPPSQWSWWWGLIAGPRLANAHLFSRAHARAREGAARAEKYTPLGEIVAIGPGHGRPD